MGRYEVHLRVYDLSHGKIASISPLLMKKPLKGIWHTAILVYGQEYFYGSYVESLPPELVEIEIQMEPIEVKFLGETRITRSEFSQFLAEIDHEFTPLKYDLQNWNCNHFTDVCARFLLNGRGISRSILHQNKRFKENLIGKGVLALLDLLTEVRKAQNPVQASQRQVSDKTNFNLTIQDKNSKRHHRLTYKAIADASLKTGGSRKSEDSSSIPEMERRPPTLRRLDPIPKQVRLGASNSRSTAVAPPEEVRLTHQFVTNFGRRDLRIPRTWTNAERCSENSCHIKDDQPVDTSDERRNEDAVLVQEKTLSQKEAEYKHQRTAWRTSNDRVTSSMEIDSNLVPPIKVLPDFRTLSCRNEDGDERRSGKRQVVPQNVSFDQHRHDISSRIVISEVFNFSSSSKRSTLPSQVSMIPSPLAMNHREVSTLFFNDCEPLSLKQSPLVKYSVPHNR